MGKRVFQLAQRRHTENVEQKKAQLQKLYRGALRIAAAAVGEAKKAVAAAKGRVGEAGAAVVSKIEKTIDLVRRVQAQTRERVFKGDTHYPDKVLSLFEPETEAIRKGKASKPTEFGKLPRADEAARHGGRPGKRRPLPGRGGRGDGGAPRSPGRGPPYWNSRVLRRQALSEEDDGQGRWVQETA